MLLGVPFGSNPDACPVRALQAWIALLDDAAPTAPLFVSLNRHSQAGDRLSSAAVAEVVKRWCAAVDLAGDFSGHSMRAGFVTTAAGAGVDALEISNQTGTSRSTWSSATRGRRPSGSPTLLSGLGYEGVSDVRRIYPAESDPAALRVSLAPAGIAAPPEVAIIAIDDPNYGAEREAPVRIIISPAQAATLVQRLRGVLDELCWLK